MLQNHFAEALLFAAILYEFNRKSAFQQRRMCPCRCAYQHVGVDDENILNIRKITSLRPQPRKSSPKNPPTRMKAQVEDTLTKVCETVTRYLHLEFPFTLVTKEGEEVLAADAHFYVHKTIELTKCSATRSRRRRLVMGDIRYAMSSYNALKYPFEIPFKPGEPAMATPHWHVRDGRTVANQHTVLPSLQSLQAAPTTETPRPKVSLKSLEPRVLLALSKLKKATVDGSLKLIKTCVEDEQLKNDIPTLTPYLVQHMYKTIAKRRNRHRSIQCAVIIAEALLNTPGVTIQCYAQQFLPSLMSIVLTKTLSQRSDDDHWTTRRDCARLVKTVVQMVQTEYGQVRGQVLGTVADVVRDPSRPITTHFGALVLATTFGEDAVNFVVVPELPRYVDAIIGQARTTLSSSIRQMEVRKTFFALREALLVVLHKGDSNVYKAVRDLDNARIVFLRR